jgi:hypothetical protein
MGIVGQSPGAPEESISSADTTSVIGVALISNARASGCAAFQSSQIEARRLVWRQLL